MIKRIHINAIKNQVDWLFSEKINSINVKDTDILLEGLQSENGVNFQWRKIDDRKEIELKKLAYLKLNEYLISHPDNTIVLFKELEVNSAKNLQSYFTENKNSKEHKEYNFRLDRWIKTIENISYEELIYHFNTTINSSLFRGLYHTVTIVCDFTNPINSRLNDSKYINFFFSKIDFNKINNNPPKELALEYCVDIHWGLEEMLKRDFHKAITEFQDSIPSLTIEKIIDVQVNLSTVMLGLKINARTTKKGISFTERFNQLFPKLQERKQIKDIDFMCLIGEYNETILNDVISSYEIIIETLKSINPIFHQRTSGANESLNDNSKKIDFPQPITNKVQESIGIKPVLNQASVEIVFEILKDFFSPEQQIELKNLLKTGSNSSYKLLFRDNGNRLTDTFKKLIEYDFITNCNKQGLINWIISNFKFINKNIEKVFVYDTVEKTISRNYYPCKSPLIEIIKGEIHKVDKPRIKKYKNN